MKRYYNDKKYYVKKALKVAKELNNKKAIEMLKILLRKENVYSIEFIKDINEEKIRDVDLFNIENILEEKHG